MSQDKSPKYTVSMMNVVVNMETQMFGSTSRTFLIIFHSQQRLRTSTSAFMVDFHQQLIPWTTSDNSTENRKCLMKDQCVICYGPIQMRRTDGGFHKEVLVIPSVLISRNNSFIITN